MSAQEVLYTFWIYFFFFSQSHLIVEVSFGFEVRQRCVERLWSTGSTVDYGFFFQRAGTIRRTNLKSGAVSVNHVRHLNF